MTNILGLDVPDIPTTHTPIGVYALVECLDEDGDRVFIIRNAGIDPIGLLGAFHGLRALAERDWVRGFEPLEDNE